MPNVDPRLAQLRNDLARAGARLYTGAGAHGLSFAGPQQAMLVIGPPRSGKTTALVVPNVLAAPGPAVSTSTKPDVMLATLPARSEVGRCWLLDPTGSVPTPPGATAVRWSPICGASEWEEALVTARAMVGAARPGTRVGEAAHWSERAEALLGPLLHAAALSHADMRAVLGWVLRHDATTPRSLLSSRGADVAADVLTGLIATDSREQSGIWSTAAGVIGAYRSPACLNASRDPNFDPTRLAGGADTVYICAPAHSQDLVAPVIVAFLESVRRGAYDLAASDARSGWTGRPPMLFALDEVANIAPLPELPAIVSEGAGQGVLTLACVQDLSQARQRWGRAAEGFGSLFGTKVVLPGLADLETLELVSRLGGDVDLPARAVSRGTWLRPSRTESWSLHRQRRLPVDAVRQLRADTALVLSGRQPPATVHLRPWWGIAPFAPFARFVQPQRAAERSIGW